MNAKFLFAATVAVSALSLVGTVAMAADATSPLTRSELKAQTAGSGILARGEIYGEPGLQRSAPSTLSRSQVLADLAAERSVHPYDNVGERYSGSTVDTYAAPSHLARAEVKAEVRHAMADGTLMRNGEGDNDSDAANATQTRTSHQHLAFASR